MSETPESPSNEAPERVSFAETLRVFLRIGLLSFGGPAGQIALMHRELVEKRRWIDEPRFLHALSYCSLLPGPEAQQLATYLGWLLHRTKGGIAAGTLFVLPGFVVMLALSMLYACFHEVHSVAGLFDGLKAVVLGIVIEALVRVGKRALTSRLHKLLAALAFIALFFFDVPFPAVIASAGLIGMISTRFFPQHFPLASHGKESAQTEPSLLDKMAARGELAHTAPSSRRASRVLLISLALWSLPLLLAFGMSGADSVYLDEGLFFSEVAMVTFGGAYAVLSYVGQRAVEDFAWLAPRQMIDGLGLAETTPGPLILVVQFVAFLGAYNAPGALHPLLAGTLGACMSVWVTFVPCFLWIFLGGPYIEALRNVRVLSGALSAITASVVGVILNLSMFFALHVLFGVVHTERLGLVRLQLPELASLDARACVIGVVGALALFKLKLGVPKTLALGAVLGLLRTGL